MGEQEMLQLLEDAQRHLSEGVSMHIVNREIRKLTGGAVNGYMSLQLAIPTALRRTSEIKEVREAAGDEAEDQLLNTFGTAGPVQHFAEGVAQGASLGFADDLYALFGDEGFGERLEARRTLNPGASLASEAVGLLVPGAGTGRALAAVNKGAGFLRSAAQGAGIVAAEGAVLGAGEAEGGLGERAKGAAVTGAISAPFGALGPLASRAIRPLRSNKQLATIEGRHIVEQTGKSAEELFEGVRESANHRALGGVAALVDADPSIAARAPGIVRNAPSLRQAGGPLESLRARVDVDQMDDIKRAIWRPLQDQAVDDKVIIRLARKDEHVRAAARQVVEGNLDDVSSLPFSDVQDILRVMRKTADKLNKQGLGSKADKTMQARRHLESQLERTVPGFAEANTLYAETLAMQGGAEKLITAIDKALPAFSPELPSRIGGGVITTVRETLSNTKSRREMIARMVGEAILEEGEEGIRRMERLLKEGNFSTFFRELTQGAPGGAAPVVPGLLINQEG